MGGFTCERIDRKSSIDSEPRTLNFKEMDIAREAALYVLHTRSTEEANKIFTKGLEAVECMGSRTLSLMRKWEEDTDDDDDDNDEDEDEHEHSYNGLPVKQRSSKDVLTAPF